MLQYLHHHEREAALWMPWIWMRYMIEAHFNFCDLMIWGDASVVEMRELIQLQAA